MDDHLDDRAEANCTYSKTSLNLGYPNLRCVGIQTKVNLAVSKQNGLVKQIEIIGEAANMLTFEFRELHTEVNWRPIVGMRNVLVHDYIHISKDMLWETVTRDIPELKAHIEIYYEELK